VLLNKEADRNVSHSLLDKVNSFVMSCVKL